MAKKTQKKIENDVQNSLPGELTEEERIDLLNEIDVIDETTDPFLFGMSQYEIEEQKKKFKKLVARAGKVKIRVKANSANKNKSQDKPKKKETKLEKIIREGIEYQEIEEKLFRESIEILKLMEKPRKPKAMPKPPAGFDLDALIEQQNKEREVWRAQKIQERNQKLIHKQFN